MSPTASSLRWGSVALLAAGAGVFVYALLCAPSRPAARLGIRGYKRQRALEDPFWRSVDPYVRWLGARLGGVLPDDLSAKVDRKLVLAGDYMGLTPPEYIAWTIYALASGLGLGVAASHFVHIGLPLVVACALSGGAGPYLVITSEAAKRMKWIGRRLPAAIDLIALAMSAGLDFPGAIRQVVEKSSDPLDHLIEELSWILHKLSLGNTRRQALEEFAVRVPSEVVLEFVGAVSQAEERGHPVAQVLQIQASTSRQRRSVRAEEAAARAGVALTGPLVLLFLAILLLIVVPIVLRVAQSGLLSR
jgi:tight adherence protein C